MVLAVDPKEWGMEGWPPCVYRELVGERRICTNGFAIDKYGLVQPNEEIRKRIKLRKPSVREFGELPYSGICRSCTYIRT